MIKTARNYYGEICLVEHLTREKYHFYVTNANSLDDERVMLACVHEYRGRKNNFAPGPRNWTVA